MTDVTLFGESPFDSIKHTDETGEWWSARELMPLLGYDRWENFAQSLGRALDAAWSSEGEAAQKHFRDARKMLPIGNGAHRDVGDRHLTRYGAYLVAMNGDPRKPEIAAAQTYFAVMTRKAEVVAPRFEIPQSFAEALELAAKQTRDLDATRAELTLVRPRAESWDVLADTGADYSVREAAYILNRDPAIDTGQNRLMALLRTWRLIDSNDRPYATHASHVALRLRSRMDRVTGDLIAAPPQVRVTVAGLNYLHRRLGGTSPLDLHQDGAA